MHVWLQLTQDVANLQQNVHAKVEIVNSIHY